MGNNTYETGLFGDGVSTTRTQDVSNSYGQRFSGGQKGVVKTEGALRQLVINFSGKNASDGTFDLVTALKLPAGAIPKRVFFKVNEAFALGGTSPTIDVGTDGTEATNGFVISEAQAEAVGTYDLTSTLTGTWAAPLAAATTVGIALGGTSPTSAVTGRGKVIVEYAEVGAV